MARRISHDERTPPRREESVGDVDRDILLTFGLETVDQEGKVQFIFQRTVLAAVALDGGKFVGKNQLGIVKQPSNQRRLPGVDRTTSQKSQEGLFSIVWTDLGRF